jgi:hypothetical protein
MEGMMKRDKDLLRDLLLEIEGKDDGSGRQIRIESVGRPQSETTEHLFQLWESGLIEAIDASHLSGRAIIVRRMTSAGHDFLDKVRDPEIWAKTKEGANKVGGFSIELLGDLAKGLIKQKIKHHTGVEI